MLAVARSISPAGDFEPETFAYGELPLWLHYERGGGKSVKAAARSLIRKKNDWLHNFYKVGQLDYRRAGANGAAMRNLPITLASLSNEQRLIRDSIYNAVITHGHPRAILGSALFALATRYVLTAADAGDRRFMLQSLHEGMESSTRVLTGDSRMLDWLARWGDHTSSQAESFREILASTLDETHRYLKAINEFIRHPAEDYYKFVGAFSPETRGSGISTVCAALLLFLQKNNNPRDAIYVPVNLVGSDTDTIAGFLGALLGAQHGLIAVPQHLLEGIQDRNYLLKIAYHLHMIHSGAPVEHVLSDGPLRKDEAFLRMLAWEIGLHEMFWDAIDVGGSVVHPALGRGEITSKRVRQIGRKGHAAKLVRIKFDCGQTCVFHARVKGYEEISESLVKDLERNFEEKINPWPLQ
jgi:ADP-ribosylglycohydrolase